MKALASARPGQLGGCACFARKGLNVQRTEAEADAGLQIAHAGPAASYPSRTLLRPEFLDNVGNPACSSPWSRSQGFLVFFG